jgi:hypothetical protein
MDRDRPVTVVPFPLARRRDLIRRQAAWFVEQSHRAAERNLARQLDVQRETMRRRGVSARTAEAEIAELEAAIRARARRLKVEGVA